MGCAPWARPLSLFTYANTGAVTAENSDAAVSQKKKWQASSSASGEELH